MTGPLDTSISLTVLSPGANSGEFVTQTWVPSEDTPKGPLPTWIVRMTVPLDALISLTVSSPPFATQTWVPSEDTPLASLPTWIVRMTPAAPAEDTPMQHAATATVATSTPVNRTTPAREKPSNSLMRTLPHYVL